jgi:hypothetical protein
MNKPYISEFHGKWEVDSVDGDITVNVGANQNVIVDKMFGPQCSSKIRARHEFEACQWVVEEENFNTGEWVERARFDAQEFYKPEYSPEDEH